MKISGRAYRKQSGPGSSNNTRAQFSIGQIVHHKLFDYRGVIFDVDPRFQGSDEWYEQVARSRPPKNKPWYHVLVDDATHQTYVAERHLEKDDAQLPINHPLIEALLGEYVDGQYHPKQSVN
ncbi:MAG: heat shock protein HspQ [Gammaproteobacteria bacterium]|nr:heat shock protein HspQ [Gammaproteobacteria bacterium]